MKALRRALATWRRLPPWAKALVGVLVVMVVVAIAVRLGAALWDALRAFFATLLGLGGAGVAAKVIAKGRAGRAAEAAQDLEQIRADEADQAATFDDQIRDLAREGVTPDSGDHQGGEGPAVPSSRFLRRLRR